jgi:hypothetical protein
LKNRKNIVNKNNQLVWTRTFILALILVLVFFIFIKVVLNPHYEYQECDTSLHEIALNRPYPTIQNVEGSIEYLCDENVEHDKYESHWFELKDGESCGQCVYKKVGCKEKKLRFFRVNED